MVERIDVAVIGAGVVGLAVARALALTGREVIVLEKNGAIGAETSSRNSEVIHAGIYYRPGGLRARLCVAGKEMLYRFCADHGVAHARCGKLIIALDDAEEVRLAALKHNAEANRVNDLEIISGAAAQALEPGLRCRAALLSPTTGIIDSQGLMLALQGATEAAGGAVVLNAPVLSVESRPEGLALAIGGAAETEIVADIVVNAAGLHAEKVARAIAGLDSSSVPAVRYAKGRYFTVSGRAPFSRLIYPMPGPDSLGVHYTLDLGGQTRLGPDIEWDVALGDYAVDTGRRHAFWQGARGFWPDLAEEQLQPGYAGLRPKITGPGEEGDFRIDGPEVHGVRGLVNLFGIESPGLTACLAIGEAVRLVVLQRP